MQKLLLLLLLHACSYWCFGRGRRETFVLCSFSSVRPWLRYCADCFCLFVFLFPLGAALHPVCDKGGWWSDQGTKVSLRPGQSRQFIAGTHRETNNQLTINKQTISFLTLIKVHHTANTVSSGNHKDFTNHRKVHQNHCFSFLRACTQFKAEEAIKKNTVAVKHCINLRCKRRMFY